MKWARGVFAREETWWLLLAVGTLVLMFWWLPGDRTSNLDTYSTEADGKRAYLDAVARLFPDVRRSVHELVPSGAQTIVIPGPARVPTREEWDQLSRFVSRGGSLLFVARADSPEFIAHGFDIALRRGGPGQTSRPASSDGSHQGGGQISRRAVDVFGSETPWRSEADLEVTDPDSDVLVRAGNSVQAVRMRIGRGTAVFVASDIPFRNRSLIADDSWLVAFRLLEAAEPSGAVRFDETLNSTGTPRVLGILLSPPFRPVTLQLLLVGVIFGWWGGRRFGPALKEPSIARRAIVEHAHALGAMHYKVGAGRHVLRCCLDDFRHACQMPRGEVAQVAQVLAEWSGIPAADIERTLVATAEALENPRVSNAAVAARITELAELRARLSGSRGSHTAS